MSAIRTSSFRKSGADHFEPNIDDDPMAQRKLRGHLEQIDYTAYASNREIISGVLRAADAAKIQKLAVAAAHARAQWVAASMQMTETSHTLQPAEVQRLAHLRATYEELTEAYEALRRMVERGYLTYRTPNP